MANFTSKHQNAFMWANHPRLAKRITNRMKRQRSTKHPVKALPSYSQTRSARAARRKKGRK